MFFSFSRSLHVKKYHILWRGLWLVSNIKFPRENPFFPLLLSTFTPNAVAIFHLKFFCFSMNKSGNDYEVRVAFSISILFLFINLLHDYDAKTLTDTGWGERKGKKKNVKMNCVHDTTNRDGNFLCSEKKF